MRAAYVGTTDPADAVRAVLVGEVDDPVGDDGWVEIEIHAAALNMHDVWMLRGIAPVPREQCVLGSDGAGTVDGHAVVVHPVLALPDPGRNVPHGTLVSDLGHGLMAQRATVPAASVLPAPGHLDHVEAAALPTAWLTAYRMLFTKANLQPGETVLVQGAGGGVATAAIAMAAARGAQVMVTSRSPEKAERALELGAKVALSPGERVPDLAHVVVETVGPATFGHSTASARVGGRLVTCGSSTGFTAELDLARVFARELTVHGSTTGTLEEFGAMLDLVSRHQLRPVVDSVLDLDETATQVRRMVSGQAFGKLCVRVR